MSKKARLVQALRVAVTLFVFISALAAVIIVASDRNTPPKFTGPVEKLSTGIIGEYSSLSIVAQEKGYFKENGLDVSLRDYVSGPPAVADVLAGKLDITTAADFVGVSNSFNNPDLRILAAQGKANSFFMVVRTDHGIVDAADLKGKRIGLTRKTAGEFYLGQYLTLNQLNLNDVQVVDLPTNALVDGLANETLDAIITFNPNISEAQKRLGSKVSVWSLQGDQKLSVLLYGTKLTATHRPEAVKRYLSALLEAEDYILMNNDDARNIVGKYLKLDEDYMKQVWGNIKFSVSLDHDLLISMEDQARWSIENNLTSATAVPDYLQLISFNALEAIKPQAITVIR